MRGSTIVAFIVGAAVGVACSWTVMKNRFAKIADEEIASVKKEYVSKVREHYESTDNDPAIARDIPKTKDPLEKSFKQAQSEPVDYTSYFPKSAGTQNPPLEEVAAHYDTEDSLALPYIIKPEAYGEYDEYDTKQVTFNKNTYKLTDDLTGHALKSEDVFGSEVFEHLDDPGVASEDVIYVRDEVRQIDYEVTIEEEE